jgi:hypothetical protein
LKGTITHKSTIYSHRKQNLAALKLPMRRKKWVCGKEKHVTGEKVFMKDDELYDYPRAVKYLQAILASKKLHINTVVQRLANYMA